MKYCPQCANRLSEQLIGGEKRKVCDVPECGFVFWNNPIPVVAAIVEYQRQIVLARNAQWPQGVFSMVTGYLEHGETPEQAVLREVKEELGLDGELSGFIGHYNFDRKNQLILAFSVRGSGEIRLNHEIAEVQLLAKESIRPEKFGKMRLTAKIFQDWRRRTAR